MAYYGVIVGKKSSAENLQGQMHLYETHYIPYPSYEGAYAATPTSSQQVFGTANKKMDMNFVVYKTPYHKVSNTSGGYTVTIL